LVRDNNPGEVPVFFGNPDWEMEIAMAIWYNGGVMRTRGGGRLGGTATEREEKKVF